MVGPSQTTLCNPSEEVIVSTGALSIEDASDASEVTVKTAVSVLLVRNRARNAEAAVLVIGQSFFGNTVVAAVPLCTNLPLCFFTQPRGSDGDDDCGANDAQVRIQLDDSGNQDLSRFAELFAQFQQQAEEHSFTVPSHHSNHDWLWSYGVECLPMAIAQAPDSWWHRMSRLPSMKFGDVDLQSLTRRTSSGNLRGDEGDYVHRVPLRTAVVTLNCAGTLPPASAGQQPSEVEELFKGMFSSSPSHASTEASQPESSGTVDDGVDLIYVSLQEACPLVMTVDITEKAMAKHHAMWETEISRALEKFGTFHRIVEERLVGMKLLAFVREDLASHVGQVSVGKFGCGALGAGNKGATAASFTIFSTSFCLVNVHLPAGAKVGCPAERAAAFNHILTDLRLSTRERTHPVVAVFSNSRSDEVHPPPTSSEETRHILEHDVVLWAGDFNMRLWDGKEMVVPLPRERATEPIPKREEPERWMDTYDELTIQRRRGGPFAAFDEAPISFAPSYKMKILGKEAQAVSKNNQPAANRKFPNSIHISSELAPSTGSPGILRSATLPAAPVGEQPDATFRARELLDEYDPGRTPAYTDRILWRERAGIEVTPVTYERLDNFRFSDHRPVRLCLKVVAQDVQWDLLPDEAWRKQTSPGAETVISSVVESETPRGLGSHNGRISACPICDTNDGNGSGGTCGSNLGCQTM